jgi:hypothetical protein
MWVMVHSVFLVLTWLAFYVALPALSLSAAAAAVYINPIMVALLFVNPGDKMAMETVG